MVLYLLEFYIDLQWQMLPSSLQTSCIASEDSNFLKNDCPRLRTVTNISGISSLPCNS